VFDSMKYVQNEKSQYIVHIQIMIVEKVRGENYLHVRTTKSLNPRVKLCLTR